MGLFSFLFRKNKQNKKLKVGLALSGGGAKGICHIGAIKAFEESGIKFDVIAGTSAGSIVGAALASGRTFDELVEISKSIEAKDIRNSKMFFMPSKTSGIEALAVKAIGGNKKFDELGTPFFCVATCLNDGKETVFSSGNVAKAVSASCCFPGFFVPVSIDGKNFVDGGILNNLPTSVLRDQLCDVIIAVDLSSTSNFGTNSTKALDVLGASYKIMSSINVNHAREIADVVIRPDMTGFKSTKLNDANKLIEEGYISAKEQMPKILHILKTKQAIDRKRVFKAGKLREKLHKKQMKEKEKFNIYAKEEKRKASRG